MEKTSSQFRNLKLEDPTTLSARDRILRAAIILFNRSGVHTTGIDRIIAEADVAKMTFYKHFPSKTLLVQAYLQDQDQACFSNMEHFTIQKSDDPTKQILGVFDFLENWFTEPDFNGCPFARGLSDFGENKDSLEYQQVNLYFARYASFFEDRLNKIMKPAEVKVALPQLLSLVAGTITAAMVTGHPQVAQVNKKIVPHILKNA